MATKELKMTEEHNKRTVVLTPDAPPHILRADDSGENGAQLGNLILKMMNGTGKVRLSRNEHLEYFHGLADAHILGAHRVYEMLKQYEYVEATS